jgi:branched-chain amino acid transport system substrate-binding protein
MKVSKTVAALLAGALIIAACGDDDEPTSGSNDTSPGVTEPAGDCTLDEPLKIGYVMDIGLGGIGDVPGSAGAEYQIEQINAAGGVGGKPIEFEAKQVPDDDPAAAQRATRELIDGGADVILGPPFSTFGLPMLEETKGEVPVLFVTSTEITLPDPTQASFLVSFNDKVQASAAAQFANEQGYTTAVTLSSTDIPYLNITTAAFTDVFEQLGGAVAADLSFSLGDESFSSQVNEIAGMDPVPDVIYSAFFLPEAGIFLKQLREAGVESAVISADGFDASQVWTAGPDAEGVFFTAHTFGTANGGKVQEFLDAANAAGKKIETISFGALGADAAQVAASATEIACSLDGPSIAGAINNLENLDVVTGKLSYAGTSGTPQRDVVILTVTDGEPTLVKAFYPGTIAQ